MRGILFLVFLFSIFCPVYTYAIYPLLLTILPKKKRIFDEEYETTANIVLFSKNNKKLEELKNYIKDCGYATKKNKIIQIKSIKELNRFVVSSKVDILIFMSDTEKCEPQVVEHLLRPFSDENIGCVVGAQRKQPEINGVFSDGIYWKYENYVKRKESEIGCVSGANKTIYAVRRKLIPIIPEDICNLGFYLSMWVTQRGQDVYFEPKAIAYENTENGEGIHFKEHVDDAREYWKLLILFWKMLIPRKGSFVYISHRVMKWFVPFNLIALLICSIVLGFVSVRFMILAVLQIGGYLIAAVWVKWKILLDTPVAKIVDIFTYFIALNISFLIGLWRVILEKKSGQKQKTIHYKRHFIK